MKIKLLLVLMVSIVIPFNSVFSSEGLKDFFMPLPQDYSLSSSIKIDNDAFAPSNKDKLYTSGLFFDVKLSETADNKNKNSLYNIKFELGQKIYTPEIYSNPVKNLDFSLYERPYAGWLYFSVTQERIRRDRSTLRFGYTLGVTGEPSFAEDFQEWVHDSFDSSDKDGNWDSQIDETIGFVFTPEYKKDIFYSKENSPFDYSVSPYLKGNVGNIFIDAAAGLELKFGRFLNPFEKAASSLSSKNDFSLLEWYVKAGFEYKHVFYNYLLEGGGLASDSEFAVDPAKGLTNASLGLCFRWSRCLLSYSIIWRSSEFDSSYDFSDHKYGAILFTYFFGS